MRIQLWCKTHNCPVGQVDPETPVFDYINGDRQFSIRWDNTYCYFDAAQYQGQIHMYLIGIVSDY